MQIYTSTVVSDSDIAKCRELNLGVLVAATASGFRPTKKLQGLPICVDNGAFGAYVDGYWFDEWRFLRTLCDVRTAGLRPNWIVLPDIVAAGKASLEFSAAWAKRLPGAPLALVVQNGMLGEDVVQSGLMASAHNLKCIFVGGDLEWKWDTARRWIAFAHFHGLQCHIGRVGTPENLAKAQEWGADSSDSSSFVRNKSYDIIENGKWPLQHDLLEHDPEAKEHSA